MRRHGLFLLALSALLLGSVSGCREGDLLYVEDTSPTFALVLDSRSWNGLLVYADLIENDAAKTRWGRLSAPLSDCPNTAFQSWARLTVNDSIPTNMLYFLEFFIDINNNAVKDSGDLAGVQAFYLAPNAVWSETKYYAAELEALS